MGNNRSKKSVADSHSSENVRRPKQVKFQEINASSTNSLFGKSFISLGSQQSVRSVSSVSRPWSRVSRKRWRESTLTLPYEASKTAWPVSQLESYFLPVFPVNPSASERNYNVITEVAKGAFGKVFKVYDINENKHYALKVLSKSTIIKENAVHQVKEEVQIQSVCGHHQFIANSPFCWQTKRNLYIVSDFIEGGELFKLLDSYRILPVVLVQLYVAQIALVLDFLHNAGVIYRDLKPENLLLDFNGDIQLVDFGLSKWLSYGSRTKTLCGTLRYMDQTIKKEISCFSELLRGNEGTGMGQISLEFFQKKPSRWMFSHECIPWEVWTLRLELITLNNEDEKQVCREKVGEILTDKILYITEVMNRHDYLPKMPNQSELELIFDTSYQDVQPYLFKLHYTTSGPSSGSSVGSTMKKLIKETLAL